MILVVSNAENQKSNAPLGRIQKQQPDPLNSSNPFALKGSLACIKNIYEKNKILYVSSAEDFPFASQKGRPLRSPRPLR